MNATLPTAETDQIGTARSTRSRQLADRLEQNARALLAFARPLTDAEWFRPVPHDGRTVGIIVDHVASVYPIEVHLAELMAAGTPIVGVTWATIHEMNAGHADERAAVSKEETLALLEENSAKAAAAIRAMTDEQLARAVPVSLYGDAELTSQFMLEDHAVRHSLHHLAKLRAMFRR